MMQSSLLPVICQRTKPPPATAAADFIGIDEATTHRWLCKGQSRNHFLPATEWICSHLAMACGLPVPPVSVVEVQSQPGVPYFGSQWQGGSLEFADVLGRISNTDLFERTHAVDLFVHNVDRHRGNYLYLELAGEVVARVIDFSHALLTDWPLPALPMDPGSNTAKELGLLLSQHAPGYTRPLVVIDRMRSLPPDWLETVLDGIPPAWLSPADVTVLTQWWSGQARHSRLDAAQSALP